MRIAQAEHSKDIRTAPASLRGLTAIFAQVFGGHKVRATPVTSRAGPATARPRVTTQITAIGSSPVGAVCQAARLI